MFLCHSLKQAVKTVLVRLTLTHYINTVKRSTYDSTEKNIGYRTIHILDSPFLLHKNNFAPIASSRRRSNYDNIINQLLCN